MLCSLKSKAPINSLKMTTLFDAQKERKIERKKERNTQRNKENVQLRTHSNESHQAMA